MRVCFVETQNSINFSQRRDANVYVYVYVYVYVHVYVYVYVKVDCEKRKHDKGNIRRNLDEGS